VVGERESERKRENRVRGCERRVGVMMLCICIYIYTYMRVCVCVCE